MSDPTWTGEDTPGDELNLSVADWARVIARGSVLAVVVFGVLLLHLLVRLVEAPFFGQRRPWTPALTLFVATKDRPARTD
ncbi:MAG: hypothetical protein AAF762_08935, partial [Pseudomonadota bacterium]